MYKLKSASEINLQFLYCCKNNSKGNAKDKNITKRNYLFRHLFFLIMMLIYVRLLNVRINYKINNQQINIGNQISFFSLIKKIEGISHQLFPADLSSLFTIIALTKQGCKNHKVINLSIYHFFLTKKSTLIHFFSTHSMQN